MIKLALPSLLLLFGAGCVSDQMLKGTTATRARSANAQMNLPPVAGPKPTLAVTGFQNQAGYRSRYDLGKNLETMLESAMIDTRSFRMVNRTALGSVLAEQNLKRSGQSTGPGAAEPGRIAAARYIVEGAITEASENVQGTGGGLRVPIGDARVGVGGEYTRAQLTAIIQVIDTTTSEIVAKETVRGTSGRVGVDLGVGTHKVSGNFGSFAKTPMAEAAQDVINQAAAFVTHSVYHHIATAPPVAAAYHAPPPGAVGPAKSPPSPVLSPPKVAFVDGPDIVINRGAEHGIVVGQEFEILQGGQPILDPDTREVIGQARGTRTALVEVTGVEAKMSRTRLKEGVIPTVGQVAR